MSSFFAFLKKKYFCKIIAHDTTENKSKSNRTLLAMMLEFSIKLITFKEFSGTVSCTVSLSWTYSKRRNNPINYLFSIK
jgi:hypothetical protein